MSGRKTRGKSGAGAVPPAGGPEDVQSALSALLAVYRPTLEEQLRLIANPQQLQGQVQAGRQSCADEFAEAYALFEKFLTEDVAQKLLPAQARELLGPVEQWRSCLPYLRCCLVFGWLCCRWPRTFRGFAYYLYEYWRCVRQAVGNPVSDPPTSEQRRDFATLVNILAAAFKPYLSDQLATVEFPAGVPDEVISGAIDCSTDDEDACAIFERLMTTEASRALLGEAAFKEMSQRNYFWFCRCWCLCSLCFGCCLGRARDVQQIVVCFDAYVACLGDCFRPLTCAITAPSADACAVEQYYTGPHVYGIEIVGTAAGAFCDHYVLEWKDPLAPPAAYTQAFIVYPPPAAPAGPGACGIVGGVLGYLQTFGSPVPSDVEVRLTVFSAQPGQAPCVVEVSFQIFETRVSIEAVWGIPVQSPPGWPDPNAQLVNTALGSPAQVASFGTDIAIYGHAWVGTCSGKTIKRYTLSYQSGFVTDPTVGPWTQFWQVDYNTPLQQAAIANGYIDLTSYWILNQFCPLPGLCPSPVPYIDWDELIPTEWWAGPAPYTPPGLLGNPSPPAQFFPVDPQVPAVIWATQSLPSTNCFSGQYTLRLTVEDTMGNLYYDTQQIWFDNKPIYGEITGMLGVPPCAVINLSQLMNAPNCNAIWPLAIQGIAYDEYILESDTTHHPSDNFGGYCLTVTRQGGAESECIAIALSVALPVPAPASPTTVGTNRIGDPGVRCATASPPPTMPPTKSSNTLTTIDARMFDAVCAASAMPKPPAGFALNRANPATGQPGDCCSFWLALDVWDTTVCNDGPNGRHQPPTAIWPFYICNDLPPQ
jgi:hypothetical protein